MPIWEKFDTDFSVSISLCGDVLANQHIPQYKGLDEIKNLLYQHECRFGNLETTIRDPNGYPAAFPGGGWQSAKPIVLDDLKDMGFNMLNTANNHSMDFLEPGLQATIENLNKRGIAHAGTGMNLQEASSFTYINPKGVKIGMCGLTSSFHDSYMAGPAGTMVKGRPGVSPLRHKSIYELPAEDFDRLSDIISKSGINSYHNQARKEGYLPQQQNLSIGYYGFDRGKEYKVTTKPNLEDLERTIKNIKEAKYLSDVIIVSVHGHQFGTNGTKEDPPQFIRDFSQKCIDAGANIIVCHGPHVVRGIELYNNGIIFHGLGNFILQHDLMDCLPAEAYNKAGLDPNCCGVGELMMEYNSNGGARGLIADKLSWESIIVSIKHINHETVVTLYPIEIMKYNYRGLRGLPILTKDTTVLKRIKKLSSKFGTEIIINEDSTATLRAHPTKNVKREVADF